MSRSDEDGLLAAVRDNFDDDNPRLVYADWLQENGDEDRAEFIRLQCAAARLPDGNRERLRKEKKAARLFKVHHKAWFGPVWEKFHSDRFWERYCHIDRGFVASLLGQISDFGMLADDVAKYAPCLRRAVVREVGDWVATVLAWPFVRTLRELALQTVHFNSLTALRRHPAWGALDALELRFEFELEGYTLRGLADAPLVQAAKRLDLQYWYLMEEPQEPSLRELRRLKIPNLRGFGIHEIDADSAAALAAWPGFKQLDRLHFSACNIEDETAITLLTARSLPELSRLTLDANHLHTPTVEVIATSPRLSRLTELDLSWNNLRHTDAAILVASTTLPETLNLDVSFNRLTERAVAKLRERFGAGVVNRGRR